MSKAFTTENDGPQPPMGTLPTGRRPVTAKGFARFQSEFKNLLDTTRPALLAAVARNETDAQARLQAVEWRMQVLHRLIGLSDPVPLPAGHPVRVTLGTRVRIQDEAGQISSYLLVGPDELDGGRHAISHASPLGRALLGLTVGAWVTLELPAGDREIQILSIELP